jgi:hypothetical protein
MKTLTTIMEIAVACALHAPGLLAAVTADEYGLRQAAAVKRAIEQRHQLPVKEKDIRRDTSALDISKVFTERKYGLTYANESRVRPGLYRVRYMEWDTESKAHAEEVRVCLVLGEGGFETALAGLYELMGATTAPITPGLWDVLKDGPGDVCFVTSQRGKPGDQPAAVRTMIWFCRDNIAVRLQCSGGTDLLPIARALDQAIQACKEKPAEQSKPQG